MELFLFLKGNCRLMKNFIYILYFFVHSGLADSSKKTIDEEFILHLN